MSPGPLGIVASARTVSNGPPTHVNTSILLIRAGTALTSFNTDLTDMGHTVTEVAYSTNAALDTAWGAGKGMIILASTESDTPGPWIKAKWQAGVPILFGAHWSGTSYGPLYGLSTANGEGFHNGYSTTVSATAHPVTSGLTGTVAVTTGSHWASYFSSGGMGVAVTNTSTAPTLAVFTVGAPLISGAAQAPGATAPARAAFMGWLQRAATLTADGRLLLRQTVDWLAA